MGKLIISVLVGGMIGMLVGSLLAFAGITIASDLREQSNTFAIIVIILTVCASAFAGGYVGRWIYYRILNKI
jgi:ABC-type xylose transport system permease subunit